MQTKEVDYSQDFNEARKIIESGDYSQCLNFDQLCELIETKATP